MVHFSGFARKMNHIPPFARAKQARKTSSLDFMYGFKIFYTRYPEFSCRKFG
ncbi:MAG: hypothetical protein U5L45_18985 [Saprospiraceae bacterium]|nr:hypothetical protein [Saprospiraceae bacterium]